MTKTEKLSSSFSKLSVSSDKTNSRQQPDDECSPGELSLDTVVQNDTGRKLFTMYLKEFNNSCDKLVTLYLICCCMQNQKRIDDRQRIKQILEKTYNVCCIRNELTHLSPDLKQKLGDSLQRKTYNESIFNAVKSELKTLLETTYFPQFLASAYFAENSEFFSSLLDSKQPVACSAAGKEKLADRHSTSLISLDNEHQAPKKTGVNGSSSFFAMPNVPKSKAAAPNSSSRVLKQSKSSSSSTSSMASISSNSKSGSKTLRNSSLANNSSKSDAKSSMTNLESSKLKSHYKSNTSINSLPPNPYHVPTKAIPVSTQDSERQSVMSADDMRINVAHHLPKLNRHIKDNIIANKNVQLNMPEFSAENAVQPMKKPSQTSQIPLSESNPAEFFSIIAAKLEDYLEKKNQSKNQAESFCASNTSQTHKSNKSSHGHHSIHNNNNQSLSQATELFKHNEFSFCDNYERLSIPYESDIDAQLDEHLNRVYSTNENLNTSKMSFVKVSSLSRSKHDRSLNQSSVSYSMPHNYQRSSDANPLNSTVLTSSSKHQHHFYKLTSTSKEVDIDDTTHQSKRSKDARKSSSTHSNRHNKNPVENYDSGVSIRSAASIERVNEWLNQSSQPEEINEEIKKPKKAAPQTPNKKLAEEPIKKADLSVKTTVAYYLPGEDLAYISTFNGDSLTLAQFKQLITKKGHFRYFFKTKSDLLDEECVVYQEATDENSTVPMFNSKVIAKIETC